MELKVISKNNENIKKTLVNIKTKEEIKESNRLFSNIINYDSYIDIPEINYEKLINSVLENTDTKTIKKLYTILSYIQDKKDVITFMDYVKDNLFKGIIETNDIIFDTMFIIIMNKVLDLYLTSNTNNKDKIKALYELKKQQKLRYVYYNLANENEVLTSYIEENYKSYIFNSLLNNENTICNECTINDKCKKIRKNYTLDKMSYVTKGLQINDKYIISECTGYNLKKELIYK